MVSLLKVSHSFVENWVFGYRDGTGVVKNEGNTLEDHSKVSHCVHNPLDLGAATTYSASLVDWATEVFFEKTSKQEIKKMTCTKNAILVNPTTRKISIRKANKIKRRRSGIPNPKLECVLEIPENPLNGYPMWRVWGNLKACTQVPGKLNVRLCHHEVQEGANQAPILTLISSLTIFIRNQWCCSAHQSWHVLELSHVELLHQVLRVLCLLYEGTLLHLLDLDT
jgi:hypothetical protein